MAEADDAAVIEQKNCIVVGEFCEHDTFRFFCKQFLGLQLLKIFFVIGYCIFAA